MSGEQHRHNEHPPPELHKAFHAFPRHSLLADLRAIRLSCDRVSRNLSRTVEAMAVSRAIEASPRALPPTTENWAAYRAAVRRASEQLGLFAPPAPEQPVEDFSPAYWTGKAGMLRAEKLIEVGAWGVVDHPLLHGLVDATNLDAPQLLALSLGGGRVVPPVTQADLRLWARGDLDIFAVSHKHRAYRAGDIGFGARNRFGGVLEAGLSLASAEGVARVAAATRARHPGRRTIVWVDNFHTRLREQPWVAECLLPYLLFDVLELDVTPGEQTSRMWLCLEKRALDYQRRQMQLVRKSPMATTLPTRNGMCFLALELAAGSFDALDATYAEDKTMLKTWAQQNVDIVIRAQFSMLGGSEEKTDNAPMDPQRPYYSTVQPGRAPQYADENLLELLFYILASPGLAEVFALGVYEPVPGDEFPWKGLHCLLAPRILGLFEKRVLLVAEYYRVRHSTWLLNRGTGQAIVLTFGQTAVMHFAVLVDLEDVKAQKTLSGKVVRVKHINFSGLTAEFLFGHLHEIRDVFGYNLRAVFLKHTGGDSQHPLAVEMPREVREFIMEEREGVIGHRLFHEWLVHV